MPITRRQNAGGGVALSSSVGTVLTFNAGLASQGAIVQKVVLINTGATARVCTVYFVEPAGSADAARTIGVLTVGPYSTEELAGPFYGPSSSLVRAKQDAGTDVVAQAVAIEVT